MAQSKVVFINLSLCRRPDAFETVKTLCERGYQVVLVTQFGEESVLDFLRRRRISQNLAAVCDHVQVREEAAKFQEILARLGLKPGDALGVTDSLDTARSLHSCDIMPVWAAADDASRNLALDSMPALPKLLIVQNLKTILNLNFLK